MTGQQQAGQSQADQGINGHPAEAKLGLLRQRRGFKDTKVPHFFIEFHLFKGARQKWSLEGQKQA